MQPLPLPSPQDLAHQRFVAQGAMNRMLKLKFSQAWEQWQFAYAEASPPPNNPTHHPGLANHSCYIPRRRVRMPSLPSEGGGGAWWMRGRLSWALPALGDAPKLERDCVHKIILYVDSYSRTQTPSSTNHDAEYEHSTTGPTE